MLLPFIFLHQPVKQQEAVSFLRQADKYGILSLSFFFYLHYPKTHLPPPHFLYRQITLSLIRSKTMKLGLFQVLKSRAVLQSVKRESFVFRNHIRLLSATVIHGSRTGSGRSLVHSRFRVILTWAMYVVCCVRVCRSANDVRLVCLACWSTRTGAADR